MGVLVPDKSIMAKADPNEIKTIIVRVPGGEVPPVPALAPKVGPHKLSPKSVGEDLCKATKDWKGMNVTCKLLVQNRKVTVQVVPSATTETCPGMIFLLLRVSCASALTPKASKALASKSSGHAVDWVALLTAMMPRMPHR